MRLVPLSSGACWLAPSPQSATSRDRQRQRPRTPLLWDTAGLWAPVTRGLGLSSSSLSSLPPPEASLPHPHPLPELTGEADCFVHVLRLG